MKKTIYNIIFVLAIANFTSGCLLAAGLGALGGGGYYAGSKSSDREQKRIEAKALSDVRKEFEEQKSKEQAADQAVASQIAMSYTSGQLIDQVAIYPQVENGVAILYGRAPNEAVAQNAIKIASQTPGVKRIVSNIQVVPSGMAYAPQGAAPIAAATIPQQVRADQQMQQAMQQQFQAMQAAPQQMQQVPVQAIQAAPQQLQQVPKSLNPAQMQKQASMGFGQNYVAAPVANNLAPMAVQTAPVAATATGAYINTQPVSQPVQAIQTQQQMQVQPSVIAPQPAQKGLKRLPSANQQPQKSSKIKIKNTQKLANSEQKKNLELNPEIIAEKPQAKKNASNSKKPEVANKQKDDDPPPLQSNDAVSKTKDNLNNNQNINKDVEKNAEANTAPQQAPQPLLDISENNIKEESSQAKPAPTKLDIPAPLIMEEGDANYTEYNPAKAPKKIAKPVPKATEKESSEPEVLQKSELKNQQNATQKLKTTADANNYQPAQINQGAVVPLNYQNSNNTYTPPQAPNIQAIPQQVNVVPVQQIIIPQQVPQQVVPLNIPTPLPAQDNDAFYEQFYNQ